MVKLKPPEFLTTNARNLNTGTSMTQYSGYGPYIFAIHIPVCVGKKDKNGFFYIRVRFQKVAGCIYSNFAGLVYGISVNTAADGRKCNRFEIVFRCQFEAVLIAICQQPAIPGFSAVYRAHCVDHKACRQIISVGDAGFSCGAPTQRAALF